MKYLLSYDLNEPGKDYQPLWDELGEFSAKRVLYSQWVFSRFNTNSLNLLNHFRKFIDANDGLLIVELDGVGWAGDRLRSKINET